MRKDYGIHKNKMRDHMRLKRKKGTAKKVEQRKQDLEQCGINQIEEVFFTDEQKSRIRRNKKYYEQNKERLREERRKRWNSLPLEERKEISQRWERNKKEAEILDTISTPNNKYKEYLP